MKSLIFLAVFMAFSNSYAGVKCKPDLLDWAGKNVEKAQKRFDLGLIAVTDVLEAKAFLFEIKACTGKIDKATFCRRVRNLKDGR